LYFPLVHRASLKRVLAVDAGTIFLRSCRFIEDGRPIFNFSDHYHAPYFEHMARLYPALRRMFAYSGVTRCMMFTRTWLEQMHRDVEALCAGLPFWKAYLQAIDPSDCAHGASEQELYFHFSLMFHAHALVIRHLRWSNVASFEEIQPDRLDYVGLSHDIGKNPFDRRRLEHLLSLAAVGSGPAKTP
jgi:hypothetical protein